MNIPALIGIDYTEDAEGKLGIVDGYEGKLIIDPPASVLEEYRARKEADEEKKRLLMELKGKEDVTLDGKQIKLYAKEVIARLPMEFAVEAGKLLSVSLEGAVG